MQLTLANLEGRSHGTSLLKLTEALTPKCEEVRAAIAYASTDNMTLLAACKKLLKPLTFFCRYDDTVPVHPDIIRWFLRDAGTNFLCRVVPDILHSKVIWWVGAGVYIGSANMTYGAWHNNIETGIFLNEEEICAANLHLELERFFASVESNSQPISDEFYRHLCKLADSRRSVQKEESAHRKRVPGFFPIAGIPVPGTETEGESRKYSAFSRDWNETLQFLRGIGKELEKDNNRPMWVPEDTPMGAHVDQFIHAYYYRKVNGDRGEDYVRLSHDLNRLNREKGLREAIAWWRDDYHDYEPEKQQLVHWAPLIQSTFQRGKVLHLSELEFTAAMSHIHALREVARYRRNKELGLPESKQDIEVKVLAHIGELWRARNQKGQNILQLLDEVIWTGGGRIEWRIWAAANLPDSKIAHVGQSTLGELVGWVLPHTYIPRNNRTLKGLFCLGFPVQLYADED